MKTLRKGSKGDEVVTLQKLLNKFGNQLAVDGEFGDITEKAVKAYQKFKGLEPDGIVGAKTWAALGGKEETTNPRCVDPSVVYAPLKACITRSPNRTIKYLAIHYTAGASSAPGRALHMKDSWEKTHRASADFGVDDRYLVQFNPDPLNYRCWSVGDPKQAGATCIDGGNRNTISIEICSNLKAGYTAKVPNHEGWYYTEAALSNAVKLAKILMRKYNIPISRVVRHYDISGKLCPGIVGWNNGWLFTASGERTNNKNNSLKWEEFKKRLL